MWDWNTFGNIANIVTVILAIKPIKEALSKPGRIKKLVAIIVIISLCLLPVFNYLGENVDSGIAVKFFLPVAIGVGLFVDWLVSYVKKYPLFNIEVKVRIIGDEDKEFKYAVNAKIGDIVEFQIQYKNTSNNSHKQVVVRDVLPLSLEYIKGSTKLYSADYPDGAVAKQDTIATEEGVNIGNYAAGANAFVRFRAKVVDDTMAAGANALVNWGQVQAGTKGSKTILQDKATVYATKVYGNKEPEPTPELESEERLGTD